VIASAATLGPVTSLPSISATESIDEIYKQLWGTSQADNAAVLDMNVVSVYNLFVGFLRLLDAGNTHAESPGNVQGIQSQFLTISSTSGIQRRSETGHIYSSSKAGLIHLTKTLSTEFAPYGIRANCIAPGLFITEMTEGYFSDEAAKVMSARGGLPKEVNPATRAGSPKVSHVASQLR
jgi:NAD(P)-dependent dehydrogenase (short-subunit alcohol dehydrogenase family)